MTQTTPATLYRARVSHKRFEPKVHEFSYDLWALKVDLAALGTLARQNLLGGRSPLSLDPHDFGSRDGSGLSSWFETQLSAHGFPTSGPHEFIFLPKLKGRGFSPLSVWSSPEALLFEVHNTAGEAHSYLMKREDLEAQHAWKRLWVSPFSDMHGTYAFSYEATDTDLDICVHLSQGDRPILNAQLSGNGTPLTPESLTAVSKAPGIAGRSTFRTILWQATKLYSKGLRPKWGPFAPSNPVTSGSTFPRHMGKRA